MSTDADNAMAEGGSANDAETAAARTYKCRHPCSGSHCYVCHPRRNGSKFNRYLLLDNPSFSSIFVNQNFSDLEELVVVPREHIGQFWQMTDQQHSAFWAQTLALVQHLAALTSTPGKLSAAFPFHLEINYGDWIVHQEGCLHHHAHLHMTFDQFQERMIVLQSRDIFHCSVAHRKKMVYPTDCTIGLAPTLCKQQPVPGQPPFALLAFFIRNVAAFSGFLQAGVPGYALKIGVPSDPLAYGAYRFALRCQSIHESTILRQLEAHIK